MSNDSSAATGMAVTVDPLTWADLSGDGARAFVADTPIGRFVFGTDNLGQAYHQNPDGGEDHPTEAAARQRAEAIHGMMLTERVGALGVTVAAVNAYGGMAAAEPREGEGLREMLIRTIGSHSMESADGDEAIADDVLAGLQRFLDAPRPSRPDMGEAVAFTQKFEMTKDNIIGLRNSVCVGETFRGEKTVVLPSEVFFDLTDLSLQALDAHPPAASAAARVAELEAALRDALTDYRSAQYGAARSIMDAFDPTRRAGAEMRHADISGKIARIEVALSPAAPEPKS